jgi:succinate-semialdehyde dehydrogenase/glutarate-semialdehyde dehydrogenase
VVDSLHDRFLREATERTGALRLGWSRDWEIEVGSLISEPHAREVLGAVGEAVAAGAVCAVGGRSRPNLGPAFVEPTILTDVGPEAPVLNRETFGPVVSLVRVRDAAEAVARANDSPYGLNAAVWGGEARRWAERLEVGSVGVNSALQIYGTFDAPMGGFGLSGFGRRHGAEGILRFGAPRTLVWGPSRGGGYDSLWSRLGSRTRALWMKRLYRAWPRIPGLR